MQGVRTYVVYRRNTAADAQEDTKARQLFETDAAMNEDEALALADEARRRNEVHRDKTGDMLDLGAADDFLTKVEAVLRALPKVRAEVEAVAWRYRFVTSVQGDLSDWYVVHDAQSIPKRDDQIVEPLYAAPPPAPAGEVSREEIAEAVRLHCRQLGNAVLQMSFGVERIYYSGISVNDLAETIRSRLSKPDDRVREAFFRYLKKDNQCYSERNDVPCTASQCGCKTEMDNCIAALSPAGEPKP